MPSREIKSSFNVSGQVTKLPVRATSKVAREDVIAQIVTRDFKNQIEQLQSQRDQAKKPLEALRAEQRLDRGAATRARVEGTQAEFCVAGTEIRDRPIEKNALPIFDQGASVYSPVNDVVVHMVFALAIVAGTLLVFMGLTSGILIGAVPLVTVAGTLFGMYLFRLYMKRISLGALIFALGMLIKTTIVLIAAADMEIADGKARMNAAVTPVIGCFDHCSERRSAALGSVLQIPRLCDYL